MGRRPINKSHKIGTLSCARNWYATQWTHTSNSYDSARERERESCLVTRPTHRPRSIREYSVFCSAFSSNSFGMHVPPFNSFPHLVDHLIICRPANTLQQSSTLISCKMVDGRRWNPKCGRLVWLHSSFHSFAHSQLNYYYYYYLTFFESASRRCADLLGRDFLFIFFFLF